MTRCPSELQLERYLLDPEGSQLEPHVAACARCTERVASMRRIGDEFRREVFPGTVEAVLDRTVRRRPARWLLLGAPLAAAAAAVAFLVARPPADYVGTKGGALGLTVIVEDARGVRAAGDGEAVDARARVRFEVKPARACRLWVVSLDGAGDVSRLYPPSGDPVDVATAATLPGGAVLDGRGGPERVFALCATAPLPYPEVERAARAVAEGGDAAVRSADRLPGLPRGTSQATVLLEKRP